MDILEGIVGVVVLVACLSGGVLGWMVICDGAPNTPTTRKSFVVR